ncbi:pentapeptide repeat-containing protein [Pseudanabaena sp. UWO310]|uniref:pentapeptide repeat-containing protein n=1 Tax=Pseudanabaena sp. UWO310 TaxID=2480795 RepID=UPI0011599584|nr:pentapeptide repeat-containing protein [Pseudanabaena sp. UWO310]TYQ30080.1 hypothetical protein PseudUWO310_10470 [Pseudanabaena sp. UWO310]
MSIFRGFLKDNLAKHQLWLESHGAKGQRFSMAGANLKRADLHGVNLHKANLSGANLSEINLSGANLSEATLFGAKLRGANLNSANLSNASLSGTELQDASLQNAILIETLLCEADLTGANLYNANLHKANLSPAIPEFVKAKNIQSILTDIHIPFINVNQTNLKAVNLSGADLSEANLDFANLVEANLSDANLSKAKLFNANLSHANLTSANLKGADLFRSQALGTNFSSANLTNACIEGWTIDRHTLFDGVICDAIYLRHVLRSLPDFILRKYCDRRPFNPKAEFAQGDFVKLLGKENVTLELENHGSEFLQEQILMEELEQIFEQLSDQYSLRYAESSVSDLQTILKLEIRYHTKDNFAFRERLVDALKSRSQVLQERLQNNLFVNVSPQEMENFLYSNA